MKKLVLAIINIILSCSTLVGQRFMQEYHPAKTKCALGVNLRHFHYIPEDCFSDTVVLEFEPDISIIYQNIQAGEVVFHYSNYLTSYWRSLTKVQLSSVPGLKPVLKLRHNTDLGMKPLLLQVKPFHPKDSYNITNRFVICHAIEKDFGLLKNGVSVYSAIGYGFTVYAGSDASNTTVPDYLPICSNLSGNVCKERFIYLHNATSKEVCIYNRNSRLVGLLYMKELDSNFLMEPLYNFATLRTLQSTRQMNLHNLVFERRHQGVKFRKWMKREFD